MNDANPDYGEAFQPALFLGAPAHAEVTADHPLGNGFAFFFEWLHYKLLQPDFKNREAPAIVLHNLSDEPDAFFLPHMALFKHSIDANNPMDLSVASIQSGYWRIPFRLVVSLTKERVVLGVMALELTPPEPIWKLSAFACRHMTGSTMRPWSMMSTGIATCIQRLGTW